MADERSAGRRVCLAVAVPGELGLALDGIRARLAPDQRHMPSHITLVPPFEPDEPADVNRAVAAACSTVPPFLVALGAAGTFPGRDPVVYLSIADGADQLTVLHEAVSLAAGARDSRPFTPHVTLLSRRPAAEVEAARAAAAHATGSFAVSAVTWFEHGRSGWTAVDELALGKGPAAAALSALGAHGLPFGVIVHTEPVHSLEQAAAARGVEVADVVKTLVVRRTADDYVLVLVPGGRALSWPKLRALLGVSRLSMPPAAEALAATGYERGTITPLGTLRPWPVIVDERITGRETITLGSGARDVAIAVDPRPMIEALAAVVADVTEPEPAGAE